MAGETYAMRLMTSIVHIESDVVYNVTGGYKLLSGLVQSYAANRGARVIYTFEGDSPLVIVDVNATGIHPEITFISTCSSLNYLLCVGNDIMALLTDGCD